MLELSQVAAIRIRLASPEQIRSWSYGQVENPKTTNYQTGRPEPGGLFCERIFGPEKDWTCYCGTYRRARRRGFTCETCGVEVGRSSLRRERMGHIELVTPVAHPWFARGTPSMMARLLGLSKRHLERVLSYSASIVTFLDEERRGAALVRLSEAHMPDPEHLTLLQSLSVGTVLEDPVRADLLALLGTDTFQTGRGAGALAECLRCIDLDALARQLRQAINGESGPGVKQAIKRLLVVEAFRASGVHPEWMILTAIPVLPPTLRPLVDLKNGHLATNDLNALYQRILCRNRRIQQFMELDAPEVILNNEKRLLQDACDALFDNGHRRIPVTGGTGLRTKPLKSLTDVISGKGGRFRKNLLGKRVDYSARSVIVGDPTLQLHQCGLPTKICLELFKPFLIRRLIERRVALSPRAAKRMVERSRHRDPVVWDVLEEVMYERAILLNRAPTLHRLGIQAFEAVRVEGNAIRLHPLVCSAYNADFDGDQMAVHLPLSDEAQKEAWELLLSTHNLRSSASGEPSISLGQDIALGLSYLTQVRPTPKSNGRTFTDTNEALLALDAGVVDLHTLIFVRTPDPFVYTTPQHRQPVRACWTRGRIETTPGRLLLNEALPEALRFRNYRMTKERIKQLIAESLRVCGPEETADLADRLKTLGFHIATRSGTSFAISDIETLSEKHSLLEEAQGKALEIEEQFLTGTVTEVEREQQLVTLWTQTSDMISKLLEARLDPFGTLATIIISGATKAKFQQIRQLSGMRGLMAGPGGRIIPIPILGNYLQGQAVWEAFIAASGARAGFMARSLNTAVTGYLTRKLVEVGQEVWITEEDCGTLDAVTIDDGESRTLLGLPDMSSRLIGRVLAEPVGLLPAGTLLDEALSAQLVASGVARVRIRSPLVCQAYYGLCRRCYGWDLATWQLVEKGLAVGVIAGQSIGEPGTQLSMRVFHTGGIAGAAGDIRAGLPRVIELFEGQVPHGKAVISRIDGQVDTTGSEDFSTRMVYVTSPDGERQAYPLLPGTRLLVEAGQQIKAGAPLTAGPIDPGDLLRTVGWLRTAQYLVQEIQHVFRGTGVYINDRHVELIARQMTRFTLITDPGDTTMVAGEILDRYALLERNAHVLAEGGRPAVARPVLLGITKAARQTRSWVAAASFQDTSRVLAWASIEGRTDNLRGLKARIVVGKPIPRYGNNR